MVCLVPQSSHFFMTSLFKILPKIVLSSASKLKKAGRYLTDKPWESHALQPFATVLLAVILLLINQIYTLWVSNH